MNLPPRETPKLRGFNISNTGPREAMFTYSESQLDRRDVQVWSAARKQALLDAITVLENEKLGIAASIVIELLGDNELTPIDAMREQP